MLLLLLVTSLLYAQDDPIRQGLLSSDIQMNWKALQEIKTRGISGYERDVLPFLEHENPKVVSLACVLLGGQLGKEGEDRLIAFLHDERSGVARSALLSLISYHDPELAPFYEEFLTSGTDPALRLIAMGGLFDVGKGDRTGLDQALNSQSMDMVIMAMQIVAVLNHPDLFQDRVLELLADRRDEVRGQAAQTLSHFAGEAARNALTDLAIRETYHYVRIAAIDAVLTSSQGLTDQVLKLFGSPRTSKWTADRVKDLGLETSLLPKIVERLKVDRNITPELVQASSYFKNPDIDQAVGAIACNPDFSDPVIMAAFQVLIENRSDSLKSACLTRMLATKRPDVISYACWYIGIMQKSGFDKQIDSFFQSEDPTILGAAVWTAGELKMKTYRERISELTNHPDPRVKAYAQEALRKLTDAP